MKRSFALVMAAILVVLIAAGTIGAKGAPSDRTPEGAVKALFHHVQGQDWDAAYSMVAGNNANKEKFIADFHGDHGSLKTISALQSVDAKLMNESGDSATVRANLEWSTAVGALHELRDLKLLSQDGHWKLDWQEPAVQGQEVRVVQTPYLRWDVIQRSFDKKEDFGAQNVEPPHMRIVSMNAVEKDGNVIILGEVVNEDTVPGFVTVSATLLDQNKEPIVEESSFDKISHTLLPKEVSPFRIDFPGRKLADVKSVRINPNTLLVPAYADPVVGVVNQRIEKDAAGHNVLHGELLNESGKPVNIPHVLATYYDSAGRVIWVSDGYVTHALLPDSPVPFTVDLRDDLASSVKSYRVTVNHYSADRI